MTKIRTIITQDAEVDDQNSLRHFLFYSNEVELLGIVQTSSIFHWRGVPGTNAQKVVTPGELMAEKETGDYDAPYRWPGTDWMMRVIDDYEKDYPGLNSQAGGYPTPEYLRSITKVGNVGYKGEMDAPSEGSELIRKAILADDPRPLYIQVWGGCNTIARALQDIRSEFGRSPDWPALHERLMRRIVITACGEQDECYRTVIAEDWPGIRFVKTLQMGSYAYPWKTMPDGESRDTLAAAFMKEYILTGKSALTNGYRTWLDGVRYEGEEEIAQFGANPNIGREWFGARYGLPAGDPYDFLSEGDSPTYFPLFDWGFRTLEDFSYGGIAGRYHRLTEEANSKGEPLDYWDVCKDTYVDRAGKPHVTESMWPYVADIQRDFAARVAWAEPGAKGEHKPSLTVAEGLDLTLKAGRSQTLHAQASSPDGVPVQVSFRVYPEASAPWGADVALAAEGVQASFTVPETAAAGEKLHIIVKAQAEGKFRLVHYQQVIVTVE